MMDLTSRRIPFLILSLMKACRITNDRVRTRLPIQKGFLTVILNKASEMFHDQPYLASLYMALMSTAYFGLFRVSELTKGQHPVLAKDFIHHIQN